MDNKYRVFQETLAELCNELGYDAGSKVPERELWDFAEVKMGDMTEEEFFTEYPHLA